MNRLEEKAQKKNEINWFKIKIFWKKYIIIFYILNFNKLYNKHFIIYGKIIYCSQ